jgi:hypothetical protein
VEQLGVSLEDIGGQDAIPLSDAVEHLRP